MHNTIKTRIKLALRSYQGIVKKLDNNPKKQLEELFDEEFYQGQLGKTNSVNNLYAHFLSKGLKDRLNPHPLFNTAYYLEQYPDVLKKGLNPLLHFIHWGASEMRSPHPLFDPSFYLNQSPELLNGDITNPLTHFLTKGANNGLNPHILFDTNFYLDQYPDVANEKTNPLCHFLQSGYKEGRFPHPEFHTDFYKETYLDGSDENPLINYARHPDRIPSPWYKMTQHESSQTFNHTSLDAHSGKSTKIPLFIVSHDASRTGAPAIILNLAKHFQQSGKFEFLFFMHRGGPLLDEFSELGPVICFDKFNDISPDPKVIDNIVCHHTKRQPALAIVNSVESNYFLNIFSENQIPTLTLVHEFATFYTKETINRLIQQSDRIIFPSQFIKDIAINNFDIAKGTYTVIPQGLLNPHFGEIDVASARASIRNEFNIPEHAFIVLCCGSGHIRKGIDYFVQIAAHYSRLFQGDDVYFLWVGEPDQDPMFAYYLQRDIEQFGIQNNLIFAGERENVEPYFVGADLFLLTSRQDPFPCVIHEAMAASLPAIVFENSGGAAESIANTGIVVPYADFAAAAEAIFKLYINPEVRKRLGEMARLYVRKHYNFHDYGQNITKYIQEEMKIKLEIETKKYDEPKTSIQKTPHLPSDQERKSYHSYFNIQEQAESLKHRLIEPVFIAGATRSGTSIMKLSLQLAYGSVGAAEGHLWPLFRDILSATEKYMETEKANLTFLTSLSLTGKNTLENAFFNIFHKIHMEGNDGRVFIDKSPNFNLINTLPKIQLFYPKLNVIFMKRHGVNNVESKMRKFPEVPFIHHCNLWVKSMEEWLAIRGKLNQFIEIDQADLRMKPEYCANRVAEFLKLDDDRKDIIKHCFSTREMQRTSKNTSVNSLLTETTWDESQKETFMKICGPTMEKFNYLT